MTPLIILTIAWTVGIVQARWLEPPQVLLAMAAIPVLTGLILYRKEPKPRFLALCGLMCLLGATRMVAALPKIEANHVAFYNEGDIRDTYTNLHLRPERPRPPGYQPHSARAARSAAQRYLAGPA